MKTSQKRLIGNLSRITPSVIPERVRDDSSPIEGEQGRKV